MNFFPGDLDAVPVKVRLFEGVPRHCQLRVAIHCGESCWLYLLVSGHMGVSKNRGKTPKMDGKNHGKPD